MSNFWLNFSRIILKFRKYILFKKNKKFLKVLDLKRFLLTRLWITFNKLGLTWLWLALTLVKSYLSHLSQKLDACFKCGQKWLKSNHLASLKNCICQKTDINSVSCVQYNSNLIPVLLNWWAAKPSIFCDTIIIYIYFLKIGNYRPRKSRTSRKSVNT